MKLSQNYINTLKGRFFGLLCEKEKDGEWEKFLDNILIELEGIPNNQEDPEFLSLYHKASALRFLSYPYFRTTIFDCMSILGRKKVEDIIYDKQN